MLSAEAGIDYNRLVNFHENQNIMSVKCEICHLLPFNPENCSKCLNIFCKYCIENNMKERSSTKCLECEEEYIRKTPQKSISRILANLMIKCRFSEFGCTEEISFNHLSEHQAACEYKTVKCDKCEELYLFSDPKEHKCRAQCCANCKDFSQERLDKLVSEKVDLVLTEKISELNKEYEEQLEQMRGYYNYLRSEIEGIFFDLKEIKLRTFIKEGDKKIYFPTLNEATTPTSGNKEKRGLNKSLSHIKTNDSAINLDVFGNDYINNDLNLSLEEIGKKKKSESVIGDSNDYPQDSDKKVLLPELQDLKKDNTLSNEKSSLREQIAEKLQKINGNSTIPTRISASSKDVNSEKKESRNYYFTQESKV